MKIVNFIVFFTLLSIVCNSQEWYVYTDLGNTFKLKFPGKPEIMRLNSGYGMDNTVILQYLPTENFDFSTTNSLTVMYISNEKLKDIYSDNQKFEFLESHALITVGLIGNVLKSEKLDYLGYPCISIEGQITQAVNEPYPPIYIKSFIIGDKMYQLGVSCSYENKDNPLIEYFFDSFEIIE